MDELFTVDTESGDTTLIPTTNDRLAEDLTDPITKVYIYVGKEADKGWKAALTAAGYLPDLKPYLALRIEVIREWVPHGNPKGVVFGTGTTPNRLLNLKQASDTDTVLEANTEAE